jgi:hypothetical protein
MLKLSLQIIGLEPILFVWKTKDLPINLYLQFKNFTSALFTFYTEYNAVGLACLFWEWDAVGSNPTTPTY